MEMHHQNKIKRYEEREVEISKWREYYCSKEGIEAEKAKWMNIYYSTLKEKEVHKEEQDVSSELSESELEAESSPQLPPPPPQLATTAVSNSPKPFPAVAGVAAVSTTFTAFVSTISRVREEK